MATETCDVLGQNEDHPDLIREIETRTEETQKPLNEEGNEDIVILASNKEAISTPNGIEKEEGDKLHVLDTDLDEFVDSVTEVTPSVLPKKPPEEDEPLVPEKAPVKLPRAEQVAAKVLRAEKVTEKAPRIEKSPGMERTPRAEKTQRAEKTARVEKVPEKARPPGPIVPKPVLVKRKTDARAKDTVPWEGLTVNKCLLVASLVALLSVGCQVVQDIIEFSENILKTELDAWMSQEGSIGELDEQWFYERWFDWSDDEEPPDVEEEEEEEVLEIEEEEEEEESEFIEREEEAEEEITEERKKVSASKEGLKKRQEKAVKREKFSRKVWKDFEHMGNGREDEDEEDEEAKERHPRGRRRRREEEEKSQHRKEIKREDHDQRKGQSKLERDPQPHQIKPKKAQRPTFSLTSKLGKPKLAERRQRG